MKTANPDDPRLKAFRVDTSPKNVARKVIPARCPRLQRTYSTKLPNKDSKDRPALRERSSSADIFVVGTGAGFDNDSPGGTPLS